MSRSRLADCRSRRRLDFGKNVEDIIVRGQRGLAELSRLNPLDRLFALEIEDGFQQLPALLLAGLAHDEKHARAVLYVAWRKQLFMQQLHDQIGLAAVKAAGIAAPVL